MKNLGLAGAIALCGIGLILIGLGNFRTQTVYAAPAVAAAATMQDKSEPTIVWYGTADSGYSGFETLFRAWSDGTVEARMVQLDIGGITCFQTQNPCTSGWIVISSPTDGLNAAADITFDEVVDGQDLAVLLAAWGEAPRNPMPPTDCLLSDLNS